MADTRITDAEIAGYMGWRGPGVYTEASLRKIREIIDHVLRAERATPPSPSTAPEVPQLPESLGLADVPHAMNTPDDWDADYRATWQKLQVADANLRQMRAYARQLRALASRPAEVDERLHAVHAAGAQLADAQQRRAERCERLRIAEVDDEGLPPLPEGDKAYEYTGTTIVYSAEQYRQGQRDAVAADRARRQEGSS